MHPRKRINIIFGITVGAMLGLVTVYHNSPNLYQGINDNNLQSSFIERSLKLEELRSQKMKVQEERLNEQNFDCSVMNNIDKVSNRSEILNNLDYEVKIQFENIITGSTEKIIRRPMFNCLKADDPYLTKIIKEELMVRPIPKKIDFSKEHIVFTSHQALDVVEMVYSDFEPGFFIEAGAGDCGATISQSLENYGWTGLLVEAVPEFFSKCKEKKRNAWLVNTCLATQNKPHYMDFNLKSAGDFVLPGNPKMAVNAMQGFSGDKFKDSAIEMQCLPFVSLLYSLGNPTVNIFVLDIEGFELAVLRTIPWDKVDIEVLSIETDLAGKFQKDSSRQAIIDIMVKNGYTRFDHREDFNTLTNSTQNDMFVRNDVVKKRNVKQLKTPYNVIKNPKDLKN